MAAPVDAARCRLARRSHAGLPAGVARGSWSVPLTVDGTRAQLAGEIWRVRRPSSAPWVGLAVAFVLATSLLALARRRLPLRQAAVALGLLAAAAEVVTAAAFALDLCTPRLGAG